jgi:hypothetical protein
MSSLFFETAQETPGNHIGFLPHPQLFRHVDDLIASFWIGCRYLQLPVALMHLMSQHTEPVDPQLSVLVSSGTATLNFIISNTFQFS